ncbi:FHIPEP family type III secretion protein [bacterium]|nr:FHIPEP family type III secretion protein [bacterium]
MALPKIDEFKVNLQIFNTEALHADFAPWKRSERGQQVYIKLLKDDQTALLYVGENCVLDAQMQQILMRLVNDGWSVAGEMTVSFDGNSDPGIDPYVYQDPIVVELGRGLLPLVDPQCGAPLVQAMPHLRDEIARESGLVPAGIRIKDNLKLDQYQYKILLKNSPLTDGEIFLDRFLAIGSFDQLSSLEGWSAVEPTYRMKAKWILENQREKAEKLGCVLVGPLQVLLTHIKGLMLESAPELLGLQDTFNLISRLQITHPVVVEEFITNYKNLRALRKILQNLLRERVALSNLVTILETVGDNLDNIQETEIVVEACRQALARQICSANLNQNNELLAIITGPEIEGLIAELKEMNYINPIGSTDFEEKADIVAYALKSGLEEAGNPPVVVTDGRLRNFLSRLIASDLPGLCVLSTQEVTLGHVKLIVNGVADLKDNKIQSEPQSFEGDEVESVDSEFIDENGEEAASELIPEADEEQVEEIKEEELNSIPEDLSSESGDDPKVPEADKTAELEQAEAEKESQPADTEEQEAKDAPEDKSAIKVDNILSFLKK